MHTKLSSLAEKLLTQLQTISHISDPVLGALTLSDDPSVSPASRKAYREIYEYLAD